MRVVQVNNQTMSQFGLATNTVSMQGTSFNAKMDIALSNSFLIRTSRAGRRIIHSIQDFIIPGTKHFYDESNNLVRIEKYNYSNNKFMKEKGSNYTLKQYYNNGKIESQELIDQADNTIREKHIYNSSSSEPEQLIFYRKDGSIEKKKLNGFHFMKVINYNADKKIKDISVFDHYKKDELVEYKSVVLDGVLNEVI